MHDPSTNVYSASRHPCDTCSAFSLGRSSNSYLTRKRIMLLPKTHILIYQQTIGLYRVFRSAVFLLLSLLHYSHCLLKKIQPARVVRYVLLNCKASDEACFESPSPTLFHTWICFVKNPEPLRVNIIRYLPEGVHGKCS